MQLTGHRDIKSFKKYNRQRYEQASANTMQNCMSANAIDTDNPISYQDTLKIETKRLEAIKVSWYMSMKLKMFCISP
jgi:hypothetical protein